MKKQITIPILLSTLVAAGWLTYVLETTALSKTITGTNIPPKESSHELLEQAEEAHYKHDIVLEKELLSRTLASEPSQEDRAIAERRLATLTWRFYSNPIVARQHLLRAEAIGIKKAETLLERVRMETALGNFVEARLTAKRALQEAKDQTTEENAVMAFAEVIVTEILHERLDQQTRSTVKESELRKRRWLREALAGIIRITEKEPGLLTPSRLQLVLALLLDDGSRVLPAWRSYYHVSIDSHTNELLTRSKQTLERVLKNWQGVRASRSERQDLILALADSRLYQEAALVALAPRVSVKADVTQLPRVAEIIEYARFCRQIQDISNEYYRKTAIGQGDPEQYQNQLQTQAESFWPRLNWNGNPPTFNLELFVGEMNKRFGAEINFGTTAGYLDLHMGHHVIDEERTVTQYNHSAKVRFLSLDSIVSNGFQSWAWDGRAQHGGWASGNTIIQVRPAYIGRALRAWRILSDTVEKEKEEKEIRLASADDERKAQADPYAFLPGLSRRLFRNGCERLVTRLRAKGLEGNALHIAFLAEFEQAAIESAIFAHEGRHAIDKVMNLNLTGDELEFRAKLSQIAFSGEPCLNLGSIFDSNIGDNTPHGLANQRIMKGLVQWMTTHSQSINGLTLSKPLLPQFDLLTDDQIRAAFRSLDPFSPDYVNAQ
ncbi:MAG: hypothetical protein AB1489_35290 [Acidobacteriota bacterium]